MSRNGYVMGLFPKPRWYWSYRCRAWVNLSTSTICRIIDGRCIYFPMDW